MSRKLEIILVAAAIAAFARIYQATLARADPNATRRITITVLVDRDIFEKENKEKIETDVKSIIDFVSQKFEKEFNITFVVVKITQWDFTYGNAEINADEALTNVNRIGAAQSSNITIALTQKDLFTNKCQNHDKTTCLRISLGGYALIMGNAAVISLNFNTYLIALHEIAHLFGAQHTEKPSVMNHSYPNSDEFDEENKNIIKANRNRDFNR